MYVPNLRGISSIYPKNSAALNLFKIFHKKHHVEPENHEYLKPILNNLFKKNSINSF